MSRELQDTWDSIAAHWNDWGPPLRPCAEDLQILGRLLPKANPLRAFLCGVTPEIALMDWPVPTDLLAMDQAHDMIRLVWPGDVPGVRHAIVGNWLTPARDMNEVAIADGSFVFFDPAGTRRLAEALVRRLTPGGTLITRLFTTPTIRSSLLDVEEEVRRGVLRNFHIFKWKVAFALQDEPTLGVEQHDIWDAITNMDVQGFSLAEMETLRFYKGKSARLYFPTLEGFRDAVAPWFVEQEVVVPTYEFGECCPFWAGTSRR